MLVLMNYSKSRYPHPMSGNSPSDDVPHVHGPNCNHDHKSKQPVRVTKRPGRNEPCWCGSDKKYKKCHLTADQS